jgi:predicted acylesterase/phospholipase RssA
MRHIRRSHVSILVGAAILCACSSLPRLDAAQVPFAQSKVGDFTTSRIRYSPFEDADVLRANIEQAFMEETPESYSIGPNGEHIYNYLSISGGGSDGAFGAGLLNGWSETGDRPQFKVVTGVSTGALIAPLAFLGSDFDQALKESYTTIDASHIFVMRGLLPMLWSESATSTKPLQDLISTYISEHVLDLIAAEYKKGRRLYVASTNIDAEQPIIWDMGAIAASGKPDRLELFRKVLLASASIPSLFPPVLIDVNVNGKKYQEMHVDGGVFFQSFSISSVVDLPTVIRAAHPEFKGEVKQNLYVLRNGWVTPTFQQVDRSIMSISQRAILSMFKVSGINDLWRLYLGAKDDNVAFYYTAIPAEYVPSTTDQFNKEEMNREYDYGRKVALDGIKWLTVPPGYAAPQDQMTQ